MEVRKAGPVCAIPCLRIQTWGTLGLCWIEMGRGGAPEVYALARIALPWRGRDCTDSVALSFTGSLSESV
jgi:hypothetical protein